MSYCIHCGQSMPDQARFCPWCGQPVEAVAPTGEVRKQKYAGVLYKCPNCGEPLQAFAASCPACGYDIRGMESCQAIREFSEKLAQLSAEKNNTINPFTRKKAIHQMIDLVKNVVVPPDKEDAFEFFVFCSSNIDVANFSAYIDNGSMMPERRLNEAWVSKMNEAYAKVSFLYRDDPALVSIQQMYQDKLQEIKKARKKPYIIIYIYIGVLVFAFLLVAFILLLVFKPWK